MKFGPFSFADALFVRSFVGVVVFFRAFLYWLHMRYFIRSFIKSIRTFSFRSFIHSTRVFLFHRFIKIGFFTRSFVWIFPPHAFIYRICKRRFIHSFIKLTCAFSFVRSLNASSSFADALKDSFLSFVWGFFSCIPLCCPFPFTPLWNGPRAFSCFHSLIECVSFSFTDSLKKKIHSFAHFLHSFTEDICGFFSPHSFVY